MCYESASVGYIRRLEAKRRAEIAQKCDALRLIDEKCKEGGSIYDVLEKALPGVSLMNEGAADTVRRLLILEGWNNGKS
jgi:hypothetical protein